MKISKQNKETFGAILKTLRMATGLNRIDFCKEIGNLFSYAALQSWESGWCFPRKNSLAALCKYFKVDKDYFFNPANIDKDIIENTAKNTIGGRIRRLRKDRNITIAGLAELTGKTRPSVSLWEADLILPSIPVLIKLSEIFNVSIDFIVTGKEYQL